MKRRIPPRRIVLGLLGAPFIALGIAILLREDPLQPLAPSVSIIANSLFGWLWIIAGTLAIAAMLTNETRKTVEEIGYGLLFVPPFVWAGAYFVTLFYFRSFYVFVGFLITSTIVVLVLYLARFMRNG